MLVFAVVIALLSCTVLADANTAASSCGNLEGTCNSQVCCCSSSGLFQQQPTDQGTCEWQTSDGLPGTIFLFVAAAVPAAFLFLMGACTATSVRLKVAPGLAEVYA